MSNFINGFISIDALPSPNLFNKAIIDRVNSDYQMQHYQDHSNFYSVLNSLVQDLKLPPVEIGIPNLFYNDLPSFNNFLSNNYADHAIFYQLSDKIAQALVDGGYGVVPTLMNFVENPVRSASKYDYNSINLFISSENTIHNFYYRYLNILLATLNKTTVPPLGGG